MEICNSFLSVVSIFYRRKTTLQCTHLLGHSVADQGSDCMTALIRLRKFYPTQVICEPWVMLQIQVWGLLLLTQQFTTLAKNITFTTAVSYTAVIHLLQLDGYIRRPCSEQNPTWNGPGCSNWQPVWQLVFTHTHKQLTALPTEGTMESQLINFVSLQRSSVVANRPHHAPCCRKFCCHSKLLNVIRIYTVE